MRINNTSLEHVSIADLVAAQVSGEATAVQIVEGYLARIAAFDQDGPALNAVVSVAADARAQAERLDQALADTGQVVGPLHGVPVVVKDNIDTADLPTSYGSAPFADFRPEADAPAVVALRNAGAIILAKTTLPDWATSWFGQSSRSGVTRNPFALDRDPGASSAGTGSAVAAAYAPVGLGTDCGGSVRLPASFSNLVGLRTTPGLNSRTGSSPLVAAQDTVGPMTRTVTDAAHLLDLMVGYDPQDPLTANFSVGRALNGVSYRSALTPEGLSGRRLGVLRSAFGEDDDEAGPVNEVMEDALHQLRAGGADLVDVTIEDLPGWIARTSMYTLTSKRDLDAFLADRPGAPLGSIDAIMQAGAYDSRLDLLEALAAGPQDPLAERAYVEALLGREQFAYLLVNLMEAHGLSALVFPTCQVRPPRREDVDSGRWNTLNFPTNTVIASQSWLPAISVPAGLTRDGLPVGLEIMTRPYAEHTMFALAYGFEQVRAHRHLPASTPATADGASVPPAAGSATTAATGS